MAVWQEGFTQRQNITTPEGWNFWVSLQFFHVKRLQSLEQRRLTMAYEYVLVTLECKEHPADAEPDWFHKLYLPFHMSVMIAVMDSNRFSFT